MMRVPFEQRVLNMIRFAFLIRNMNDENENQVAEIGFLGRQLRTKLLFPYGLSAIAPRGSQLLVWSISGMPNNSASLPTYPQERRKQMVEWEVSLENQKSDAEIFLKDNGDVDVLAPKNDVNITANRNVNIDAGDTINVTAQSINLTGGQQINLSVGGQSIVITQSGITINGTSLGLNVGSVSHNGTNIGSDHTHLPGTYRDGSNSPLSGESGEVTS